MSARYRKVDLYDRKKIEEGLARRLGCREIADSIGRAPSTVSNEVRSNRSAVNPKERRGPCRYREMCPKEGASPNAACEACARPGARCAGCDARDCRASCASYLTERDCERLLAWPWVCNGCPKFNYGCRRANRWRYSAPLADAASSERRSEARRGIDLDPQEQAWVLEVVADCAARGLSPYETVASHPDLPVSASTVYRWFHEGWGGLTLLDLERQVRFKPRSHAARGAGQTPHEARRAYARFLELPEDLRLCAAELDSVVGFAADSTAILSVYVRVFHLQLFFKYGPKGAADPVDRRLAELRDTCGADLASKLFPVALADNGPEFAHDAFIARRLLGEGSGETLLFYCDPGSPHQKGACEKNHTELRQVLPKGRVCMDDITQEDLSVVMSHVNSNPRRSLGGLSPIQAARAVLGDEVEQLLEAWGVDQVGPGELFLKPDLVNLWRERRGEPLVRFGRR